MIKSNRSVKDQNAIRNCCKQNNGKKRNFLLNHLYKYTSSENTP